MSNPLPTMNALAVPPMLGVLLTVLATYVTFEVCHRVRRSGPTARMAWLVLTAVSLSCGICAAQLLSLADLLAPHAAGFRPDLAIAAAIVTLALTLVSLNWVFAAAPGWPQILATAPVLGLAALSAHMLLMVSIGMKSRIDWDLGRLAWAWSVGVAGLALAMFIYRTVRESRLPRVQPRQLTAAGVAALAVLACQSLTISAAGVPANLVLNDTTLISTGTVNSVVAAGAAAVLLLMLVACVVESIVRRSRDSGHVEVQDNAFRDNLTRLPTRSTFNGTLTQALQQADARKSCAVLLHIALDGFNHVNDNLGHEAGDAVLKSVANRLRALAQPYRVARLGGDEFLMLHDGDNAEQSAKDLAANVLKSIEEPCSIGGRKVNITCSIGLAVYPKHGAMSTLIKHASIATRVAKGAGGATYSFFDPRMLSDARDQSELLRDLRLALSRGQLELFYQPKIDALSGQITAAEALLRWHHPQRGMISPGIFIPIAEQNGLINALGAWVIDEACKQARQWRDQGLRMRVAINLSAHQLRQHELPAHVTAALAKHQINPDLLTCEITESVAMEDTESTFRFFTDLAAVGVHISIDDFGSGYSSLAYLRKLPATELKIDRSFVLDLESSENARKVAAAVVNLAQSLNMKVVAEGVETDAQYQILRRMGCDQVQGFLFAKPMSAMALGRWAMDNEGPRTMQFRESLFKETRELVR